MESETDPEGDSGARSYPRIIAAVLCLLLLLVSLMLVSASSHAARVDVQSTQKQSSQLIPLADPSTDITATTTGTPTPTSTATNTPTPSPTHKPNKTPTATPTTRPTPTAGATATPTTATTPQSTATATKIVPTATQTQPVGTDQTPTTISSGPTTTTNGGSTPPQNQSSNNNSPFGTIGNTFLTFIIGALVCAVIISAMLGGLLLLRKRLLLPPARRQHLPPSGAQPWQRTRTASMNGNTNLYGIANGSQMPQTQATAPFAAPNANFASSANTMSGSLPPGIPNSNSFPGRSNGFPPSNTGSFSGKGNGFPPPNPGFSNRNVDFSPGSKGSGHLPAVTGKLPPHAQESGHLPAITGKLPSHGQGSGHLPVVTGGISSNMQGSAPVMGGPSPTKAQQAPVTLPPPTFSWSSDDLGPFADQVKPVKRSATRLIPLEDQVHTSSGALPTIPGGQSQPKMHPISEELPPLDDPFFRDTFMQYLHRNDKAEEKEPK